MGKIIALDYGLKRTGIAYAEAPLFIAHPLITLKTVDLFVYLNSISQMNEIVLGEPKSLDGSATDITRLVYDLKIKLQKKFPRIVVNMYDERFTSKIAMQSLILSGVKKNDRQKKGSVDSVAAVLILQGYLENNKKL